MLKSAMVPLEIVDLGKSICTKLAFWVTPENAAFAQIAGHCIIAAGVIGLIATLYLHLTSK